MVPDRGYYEGHLMYIDEKSLTQWTPDVAVFVEERGIWNNGQRAGER